MKPLPLLAALAIPALGAPPGWAAEPAAAGDSKPAAAPQLADADPAGDSGVGMPLPPGSPADQALWKLAIDVSNQITIERVRAGRVQIRLTTDRYLERLSAMGADPASAERARELRKRLEAAWSKNYSYLTSRWPVDPTRGCGYPALTFHSALHAAESPQNRAILLEARADVESCLAKARPAVATMKASNDELEAVAAEASAALAAAGLGSPASAPDARAETRSGAGPAASSPPTN